MKLTQMTCKNCKHWDLTETCETPLFHPCKKSGSEELDGFVGGDGGEPYNSGGFASGPDFGCIHWEPA